MLSSNWPAILLIAIAQASGPADPRTIVARVTAAVERDSAASVAAEWNERVGRRGDDPAALLALGTLARLTYDYPSARRRFEALTGASSTHDPGFAAYARLGLAEAAYAQGKLGPIDELAVRARADARAAGDRAAEGDAMFQLARVRVLTRGAAYGLALLDSALRVLPPENQDVRASARCLRAQFQVVIGTQAAHAELRAALDAARRAGEVHGECACLRARAMEHRFAGRPDSAVVVLREVERLRRSIRDHSRLAEAMFLRGNAALEASDYVEATRAWHQALTEAGVSHNLYVDASVKLALAALYFRLNDAVTATRLVNESATEYAALADTGSVMMARSWRMHTFKAAGDLAAAQRETEDVLEFFRREDDVPQQADLLRTLADIAIRQRDWPAATAALDRAEALLKAHSSGAEAADQSRYRGRLALHQGDLDKAERHFIRYAGGLDATDRLARYEARAYLAEVHARRGELARAEGELMAASDELETWRATLPDRDLVALAFQASPSEDNDRNASIAEVIARLAAGGRDSSAFELAERRRGRDLADRIRRASVLHSDGAGASATSPPPRSHAVAQAVSIASAIPDDSTAILEYATGAYGSPTTAFVVRRPGPGHATVRGVVLPPADSLVAPIAGLVALIESGRDSKRFETDLARSVLWPVIAEFGTEIRRVVIVPDGPLHRLPFDALRLDDGRYTVERFSVSFAPSAAIAAALWSGRDRRPDVEAGHVRLLAFGDPTTPEPAPDRVADLAHDPTHGAEIYRDAFEVAGGLPRLAASAREARRVARYAATSDVRLGPAASATYLERTDLTRYQVVHFATHAVVDEHTAARTALVLAPGDGESGFVGPADLAKLRLEADLVVLSACRSAGGVVVDGEGIQGLSAPLLQAGARSVVASRWRIGDRWTVPFIDALYSGMAHGLTTGDALRAAKLEAIRRGRPPREWAAFSLLGDPLVRLGLREPRPEFPAWVLALALGVMLVGLGVWSRRRRA